LSQVIDVKRLAVISTKAAETHGRVASAIPVPQTWDFAHVVFLELIANNQAHIVDAEGDPAGLTREQRKRRKRDYKRSVAC